MTSSLNAFLRDAFNPETLVGALWYAFIVAIITLILTRVVHFVVRRGTRYLSDPTAGSFLAQFLHVVVVVGALILYAHIVPALRSVGTALLTGFSVGAVVLGLAAQNTLGNLIAGFSILLYHPFRVGDDVEINTPKGVMRGTITQLSLGYTTLHASSTEEIIVPNNVMASAVLIRSVPGAPSPKQETDDGSRARHPPDAVPSSSAAGRSPERERNQQPAAQR
ncbi:MAG: mechanosensitive ion channel family protein [Betaproteobacteria bacterium]|nr:MAG: mechanosensitive ion channel family protein [Betaproteobacteria bacterium]